jgi:hypothetical protein
VKRKTPLVRKGWPQGRSARQLVRRSDKAKAFASELEAVTPALLERAKYLCERCREAPVEHRHHRLRRSQGGKNTLDNLLALCHDCHEIIHHWPEVSYYYGWMIRGQKG